MRDLTMKHIPKRVLCFVMLLGLSISMSLMLVEYHIPWCIRTNQVTNCVSFELKLAERSRFTDLSLYEGFFCSHFALSCDY